MLKKLRGWARRLLGGKTPRPSAPAPAVLMHYVPPGARTALVAACGVLGPVKWTVEHEYATCPDCRARGAAGSLRRLILVR